MATTKRSTGRSEYIRIRGARTHNLKDISIDIPKNQMVVITGLSGSGKSSLAFDTLYAEGQRRYAESVSAYARQFMGVMDRADVDSIEGLSPSIAIEQHTAASNARSTVATVTEIGDYLRLVFAKAGIPYCPKHRQPLRRTAIHEMVEETYRLAASGSVMILARVLSDAVGLELVITEMRRRGFVRLRIDGEIKRIDELPEDADDFRAHTVDVVVDRVKVEEEGRARIAEAFESATKLSHGTAILHLVSENRDISYSVHFGCPSCDYSLENLTVGHFSFNNPLGACPHCHGLGESEMFDPAIVIKNPGASLQRGAICGWSQYSEHNYGVLRELAHTHGFSLLEPWNNLPEWVQTLILYGDEVASRINHDVEIRGFKGVIGELEDQWLKNKNEASRAGLRYMRRVVRCGFCSGTRYRKETLNVFLGSGEEKYNIAELSEKSIRKLHAILQNLDFGQFKEKQTIAAGPLEEISKRLSFLCDVGLGYLSLSRRAKTLSGGEMQRIRLAGQIGSGLTGVTYVLDEPTIGLHQCDCEKLIMTMKRLAQMGNNVIVVEHDEDVMRAADYIVDMGPGAGELGGEVIAAGTPRQIMANENSLTGQYLSGKKRFEVSSKKVTYHLRKGLTVEGARGRNLKNVTCHIPAGVITVVTGVSGSGKSTLINDTLAAHLRCVYMHAKEPVLPFERIGGMEHFNRVIAVDQSPIGRTPRSNPASYTGLFPLLRDVYAKTPAAQERGYDSGRFSFNIPGGRCEACQGDGQIKIEMGILPSVYVTCTACQGRRYNPETLDVKYKGYSIADILEMTVSEALEIFGAWPAIERKLQTLQDVGLGYIRLGQSAMTFSGGEAQRIKLAEELSRRENDATVYVLDEPTTGLHFEDVALLMKVLRRLTNQGNTVIMIEHNLDVIKMSDWIIEIGPGCGSDGGELVVEGAPETIASTPQSPTGRYLGSLLKSKPAVRRRTVKKVSNSTETSDE